MKKGFSGQPLDDTDWFDLQVLEYYWDCKREKRLHNEELSKMESSTKRFGKW